MHTGIKGSSSFTTHVNKIVVIMLLIASTSGCQERPKLTTSKSRSEIGAEITRLTQQRRYDEAVNLGLSGITGKPEDAALYRSIAVVYTVRAQSDPQNRERWLQSAVELIDKSLSFSTPDPLDKSAGAQAFETIGDLSEDKSCQLYKRAESLWKEAAAEAEDHPTVTMGSQVVSTASIKQTAETEIGRISSKRKARNCP
jgi:hypothetical protein